MSNQAVQLPGPGLVFRILVLACIPLLPVACSRPGSSSKSQPSVSQGITGRFEALGGAHPPDPGCENLTSPTERDSCEKEYLSQMMWPLQGFAVVRNSRGDSLVLKLDSLGGYRAEVPPGLYSVCVRAAGIELPESCRDSVEVKSGEFTPYSRPFPLP